MRFKAQIIENDKFYLLKRNDFLITIIISFVIGVLTSRISSGLEYLILLIICAAIGLGIKYFKNKSKERHIELYPDRFDFFENKQHKGRIPIADINQVTFRKNNINGFDEFVQMFTQKGTNFIQWTLKGGYSQKLNIFISDNYQMVQLEKLINHWSSSDLEINIVD